MKNIHLLPTEKPSYLYKMSDGKLYLSNLFEKGNSAWVNQHIYITNDEKPKSCDWCFNPKTNKIVKVGHHGHYGYSSKKIILTTDQDLIADGVQAIDDEFLEWFVKNPSCEFVEVQDWVNYYKVFIPQEEPKQSVQE